MALLIFACLACLPGLVTSQNTLSVSIISTQPINDSLRYDWDAARDLLLDRQPPLWHANSPLLASSPVPALYPFSILYYVNLNIFLFAAFHLWVALIGIGLLAKRLQNKAWRISGILAGFALVLVGLPALRPDHMAALAWLPLAIWLPLSSRRYVKMLGLALALGFIALAVETTFALTLLGGVSLWLILVEAKAGKWKSKAVFGSMLWAIIVLALALGLAGPQLFPRLSYQPINYSTPATLEPQINGATLLGIRQINETDLRYTLQIDSSSTSHNIEMVVPERYDSGWQAQYSLPDEPNKFSEAKLVSTPEGWRKISLESTPGTNVLTVRLRYNPISFTLGLYATFLSVASMAMILLVLGWIRFYREDERDHPLRRIVKNSVTPMFAQLAGKVIDFGFAFISLRLLGPEGNGRYTFAVTTWLFFNTLADFGLETLVTREVARDRSHANTNRYFSTMLVTRLSFSALSLPIAMLWVGGFSLTGEMTGDVALAVALLMVGMMPSAVSGTLSAVFRGHEKFEYLAANQILGSIIKVPLGLGALLIGWGVAGLAATSIAVNLIAMSSLWTIFTREVIKPDIRKGFERALVPAMLKSAFPLMLNGFLISIMFKSDVFLLFPFRGDIEVGLYNSGYKFIDALLIFPSAITLALFPLFSTYSRDSRENLMRAYSEALRLLIIIGLPISAGTLFIANDLIGAAFGDKFLPGGAIALQILIWFLPFSYINGVTQYVLIALDKQRYITIAVLITAGVNIGGNLIFIPFFGYIAASAMTIATEVILLIIYSILMRRMFAPIPFFKTMARPVVATLVMMAVLTLITVVFGFNNFFVTIIVGVAVFLGGLVLFGGVTGEDMRYLRKIVRK